VASRAVLSSTELVSYKSDMYYYYYYEMDHLPCQ
jgi:hypothetical protein